MDQLTSLMTDQKAPSNQQLSHDNFQIAFSSVKGLIDNIQNTPVYKKHLGDNVVNTADEWISVLNALKKICGQRPAEAWSGKSSERERTLQSFQWQIECYESRRKQFYTMREKFKRKQVVVLIEMGQEKEQSLDVLRKYWNKCQALLQSVTEDMAGAMRELDKQTGLKLKAEAVTEVFLNKLPLENGGQEKDQASIIPRADLLQIVKALNRGS